MRDGITTDFADGFRQGWVTRGRKAQDSLIQMAAALRADGHHSEAALIEVAIRTIEKHEIPPPHREPTGLEYRG